MSDFFSSFTYIELLGYIGTAFVLLSFFMKDLKTLRKVSIAGCAFFILYGFLLEPNAYPVIVTNSTIIVINAVYLLKGRKA